MKIGILIGILTLIVGFPLALIWSLNTLFNLHIAYTFWTWLATICLSGPFLAIKNSKGK